MVCIKAKQNPRSCDRATPDIINYNGDQERAPISHMDEGKGNLFDSWKLFLKYFFYIWIKLIMLMIIHVVKQLKK